MNTVTFADICAVADSIRRAVIDLFGGHLADRVALAPGGLAAIEQFLPPPKKVVISTHEYYTPEHFPGSVVVQCPPPEISNTVNREHPDVVLVSVVGWTGEILPVAKIFAEIRRQAPIGRPILIADYSHAGACGFPPMSDLNADLVCGDAEKWVTRRVQPSPIAFCWFSTPSLFLQAIPIFRRYFLALSREPETLLSARWLDPYAIKHAAARICKRTINRNVLCEQFSRNLRFAKRLAIDWGLDHPVDSCILRMQGNPPHADVRWEQLQRAGLAWHVQGFIRVMCRLELLEDGIH